MKIIIIDDESAIRKIIKRILVEREDIELIGESSSVNEAILKINEIKPEIILLDINIIGGTAFDILKSFPNPFFKIIFITNYGEHALSAIKVGALDYILKPIDAIELNNALNKIKAINGFSSNIQFETATSFINGEAKRLVVRTFDAIYVIHYNDLMYCESDKGYTTFYLNNGTNVLVSKPIKEFDFLLNSNFFFKTHQSFIVNIDFVASFKKDMTLVLKNKVEIPVSFRRKDEVIKFLGNT